MKCPSCNEEMINGSSAWKGVQVKNNYDINPTLALVGCDNFQRRLHGEEKQEIIYPDCFVCPSCGLLQLYLRKPDIPTYKDMINKSEEFAEFADKYEDITGKQFKLKENIFKTFGRYVKSKLPKWKGK